MLAGSYLDFSWENVYLLHHIVTLNRSQSKSLWALRIYKTKDSYFGLRLLPVIISQSFSSGVTGNKKIVLPRRLFALWASLEESESFMLYLSTHDTLLISGSFEKHLCSRPAWNRHLHPIVALRDARQRRIIASECRTAERERVRSRVPPRISRQLARPPAPTLEGSLFIGRCPNWEALNWWHHQRQRPGVIWKTLLMNTLLLKNVMSGLYAIQSVVVTMRLLSTFLEGILKLNPTNIGCSTWNFTLRGGFLPKVVPCYITLVDTHVTDVFLTLPVSVYNGTMKLNWIRDCR